MTRRAYLYFVLTFLLGGAVGGSGMYFYAWHSGRWSRGFSKEHVVRHLKHELGLSEPQVHQLHEILDEFDGKFAGLHRQVEPQFTALEEERRNRIRQILNPEQVAKFNDLVRGWEERRKKQKSH